MIFRSAAKQLHRLVFVRVLLKDGQAHQALHAPGRNGARIRSDADRTAFMLDGEMAFELPDKHMTSINMAVQGQKIHVVTIANGTKQKSTMNGMDIPIGKAEKKEVMQMMMVQEISQLTSLIDSKKYAIKAEKDEDVKEMPADVVLVTAEGLNDIKLYFDKKTNMLVKTSRTSISPGAGEGVEVLEESFLSDFKKIDGQMVYTKLQVKHDGKKFMTITMSEIKLMEKADPKTFAVDD